MEAKDILKKLAEDHTTICMQSHATGKTFKMLEAIVNIVKQYHGGTVLKMLVVGQNQRLADNLRIQLKDMIVKEGIDTNDRYCSIKTKNVEIVFEGRERASKIVEGVHPDPLRFVDHYVKEVMIHEGLAQTLKNIETLERG